MLGRWLRDNRRRRLSSQPFPEEWRGYLETNVAQYSRLAVADQDLLRYNLRIFVAEKWWEGCGGLELTDEMRVTVAAQACLLSLHLPEWDYPNVRAILIYPERYRTRQRQSDALGIVTERKVHRFGEATLDGPVVLSWSDIIAGPAGANGHNLVFHEFAHKLDMLNGTADGVPPLDDQETQRRWISVMNTERMRLARGLSGFPPVLDPYGAQDPAEFFAVATVAFFQAGSALHARHPELYAVLRDFYRQDTAGWGGRGNERKNG